MSPNTGQAKPSLPPPRGSHHSTADWDFRPGILYLLDPDYYVSSPSSLRLRDTTGEGQPVLCRIAETLNLPQARLTSYLRVGDWDIQRPLFYFRQQSPLGAFDINNTYRIGYTAGIITLIKRVAGVTTTLGTWSLLTQTETWYQDRYTWWKVNGDLYTRCERYIDTTWTQIGDDIPDHAPSFEGSGQNRCGPGVLAVGAGAYFIWFDDTIIEMPT